MKVFDDQDYVASARIKIDRLLSRLSARDRASVTLQLGISLSIENSSSEDETHKFARGLSREIHEAIRLVHAKNPNGKPLQ